MDWSMRWRVLPTKGQAPTPVLATSFGLNVGVAPHASASYVASSCCLMPLEPQGKYYQCLTCQGATGLLTPSRDYGPCIRSAMGVIEIEKIENWITWCSIDVLTATLLAPMVTEALLTASRAVTGMRGGSVEQVRSVLPTVEGTRRL